VIGRQSLPYETWPDPGLIDASPLLADGKLYYVSQHNAFQDEGTYVLAAEPKFKLLAHNTFEDGSSRANASIAAVNRELLLRTDHALYCIANVGGRRRASVQDSEAANNPYAAVRLELSPNRPTSRAD
jgi:hypothetical protein